MQKKNNTSLDNLDRWPSPLSSATYLLYSRCCANSRTWHTEAPLIEHALDIHYKHAGRERRSPVRHREANTTTSTGTPHAPAWKSGSHALMTHVCLCERVCTYTSTLPCRCKNGIHFVTLFKKKNRDLIWIVLCPHQTALSVGESRFVPCLDGWIH